MELAPTERRDLVTRIIRATEEGRVTDWVERIAEIARKAQIHCARVNWNQAPYLVAIALVDVATRLEYIDQLKAALAEVEAEQKRDL